MDTVTHALIGTAIAESAFRNRLGRKALIAGAIFASLPDSDMFLSISGDPTAILRYHRAATHSILLACIAAPILGWIGWKLSKRTGRLLSWGLLAFLCLLSHDLLDLATTWGTEILYPITNKRFAIDALPIVDPLFAIPLVLAFLCTLLLKNLRIRRIIATAALCWGIGYGILGYTFSREAVRLVTDSAPTSYTVVQSKAVPNTGTILLWHVVLKDQTGDFFTASVSTLSKKVFNKENFDNIYNQDVELIRNSKEFEIIRRTSSDLLLAKEVTEDNRVIFIDMRYAMLAPDGSSIPMFFFDIGLDKVSNKVLNIQRPIPDRKKSGGFSVYWNAIFN